MRLAEFFLPNTGMTRFYWTKRLARNGYVSRKASILGGSRLSLGHQSYIDDYVLVDATFGDIIIGEGSPILRGTILDSRNGSISIGDETYVEPYCIIYGQGGVKIGGNVAIAPKVIIAPYNHAWPSIGLKETKEGIKIEDDVWLGTGSIVLDGVTIGKGSVVGAGAVVTSDIPANCLAVGNPARVVRQA